jgi:catechol 2,3-dioxygenase-like lactoylglutathione lyase family enzyme
MEVLSSRALLRPRSFEQTFSFYAEHLGLHVYREWGSGRTRGGVFFLGGGFLEVSGQSEEPASAAMQLWLQVRNLNGVHRELEAAGVPIVEAPSVQPWGLLEMRIRGPDGVTLVIVEVPGDHPLRRRSELRGAS